MKLSAQVGFVGMLIVTVCMTGQCGEMEGDWALNNYNAAIVNGAIESGYPAVGALVSAKTSACTATLINQHFLLTAAHCVANKTPIYFFPTGLSGLRYAAKRVVVHPDYRGGNQADVALVQLADKLTGITLPKLSQTAPKVDQPVVLVGFGKPAEGEGKFGVRRSTPNRVNSVAEQIFTIFGTAGDAGNVCDGDSGGPTFVRGEDGSLTLLGVHSTKGGDCGELGYDMRIDVFAEWITAQIGGAAPSVGPTSSTDRPTKPEIRLLTLNESEKSAGNVGVEIVANTVGVEKIQVLVDGQMWAVLRNAPYQTIVKDLANGLHELEAIIYDTAGNRIQTTKEFSLDNSDISATSNRMGGCHMTETHTGHHTTAANLSWSIILIVFVLTLRKQHR